MTQNQIRYWELMEHRRANTETQRHNVVSEQLTAGSVEASKIGAQAAMYNASVNARLAEETARHNAATEANDIYRIDTSAGTTTRGQNLNYAATIRGQNFQLAGTVVNAASKLLGDAARIALTSGSPSGAARSAVDRASDIFR